MDRQHLSKLFTKFEESQKNKETIYYSYYKAITTLSVGLIGLLVGLKADNIPNSCAEYSFLLTIILIGLCILFSLAVQFRQLLSANDQIDIRKQHILTYISDPEKNDLQISKMNRRWIYTVFELLTIISLVLSILSLILYVYFLEFS